MRVSPLLALALWSPSAEADPLAAPRARAGTAVYADDQDTTVVSPHASVEATLLGSFDLEVGWNADVISSASVDVVTAATTRMTELRNEATVAVARADLLHDLDADASYAFSRERDAESHTAQVSLRRELDADHLVVGGRLGASYNRFGTAGQPSNEWDPLWVPDLELSVERLLGPRAVAVLLLTGMWASGYQESPYRRVPVGAGPDLRAAQWLPEDVPDDRLRGAATIRLRAAPGRRWVAALSYRFYADDWGVLAHTQEGELAFDVSRSLSVRLRERGTLQTGADFYRERYDAPAARRTRDRRLGPHLSAMAGLGLSWTTGALSLRASADAIAWRFDDLSLPSLSSTGNASLVRLTWVTGALAQAGAEVTW